MKRQIIGLTGGIASGKSTVVDYLRSQGYAVIDADAVVHDLQKKGGALYQALVQHFGQEILGADGELDRPMLSAQIFASPESLAQSSQLQDQIIQDELARQRDVLLMQHDVLFMDIPLLFELDYQDWFDQVWLVYVTPETQVKRLMARNDFSQTEAEQRIASQMPLEDKRALAHIIIDNNGSKDSTLAQVDKWLEELKGSLMSKETYFNDNRANWNDRARLHEEAGYGIAPILADPTYLTEPILQDRELIGDLTGKSVLHLQCHLGTDTISLARLGAERVVGLDLSDESLRRARRIAQEAGVTIDFIEANVYDARSAVEGDFDLVYTSLGVLCWLPDIDQWGRVVASLLKSGGRFIIRDDHPMAMTIGDDVSQGLKVEAPYFETKEPLTWEQETSYIETTEGVDKLSHTRSHQWNHAFSQVIMALIKAGLQIDLVDEGTCSAWAIWPELMTSHPYGYQLKEGAERLPLQFLIAAHKN